LEAAWLAALAAMIDRPLPSDVRDELSAAVTERMIQARARGETDLALSLCHAIAQLGEPADLAVAELTAALANERNDARREFLVETLVALGATGRSAAVARLTLLAASNDAGAKRDVRSILDSLGRQGPRATDAIPALLEMLAGQHARVASDSLMRIDPGGEASRTFVRSKLSDPNLSQVERRHFKELEQAVEGCFTAPAYSFSLGFGSGLP
jgi:hypothetical protein